MAFMAKRGAIWRSDLLTVATGLRSEDSDVDSWIKPGAPSTAVV
jgi:hypothetical protein